MADQIVLVRHGETEWSRSGQHTSTTDLPLTPGGEQAASALGTRLKTFPITAAFTSPRRRASDTAALALAGTPAVVTDDLAEWNYGRYEGLTKEQILERDPGWILWKDGCPDGESPNEIKARTKRLIGLSENLEGTIAYFAHGHILRALAVNWLDLDMSMGERFFLDTTSISVLSSAKGEKALASWNT